MNFPDSFNLNITGSIWVLLALIFTSVLFVLFNYRYTLPLLSGKKKWFLVSLRTIAFMMLIIALFEPILALAFTKKIFPRHYLFIDHSASQSVTDRIGNRTELRNSFFKDFTNSPLLPKTDIFLFGENVSSVHPDSMPQTNFFQGTNLQAVFSFIERAKSIPVAVTVISDGIINSGANPLSLAERLGIPVFTVTVGDSTKKKDISVSAVILNEFVEPFQPTPVAVTIQQTGFSGETATVTLFDENIQIDQRIVSFSASGGVTEYFTYTPAIIGERKLTVTVSPLKNEFNTANNKNIAFTTVKKKKTNIVLFAGSPSADMSMIRTITSADTTLTLRTYTQIGTNKHLEQSFSERAIDSASLLILLDFPTNETNDNLSATIINTIKKNNTPIFVIAGQRISSAFLKQIEAVLPVNIKQQGLENLSVQSWINYQKLSHPVLKVFNSETVNEFWDNLPPVRYSLLEVGAKSESDVLISARVNTTKLEKPILISRRFSVSRSIYLAADNIWRWQLNNSTMGTETIQLMFRAGIRWLIAGAEKKQFSVKPVKKALSSGEKVEFIGELRDDGDNPLSDASIKATVTSGKIREDILFKSLGNGVYSAQYAPSSAGDYFFTAEANAPGITTQTDKGRFNVGELDREMFNTVADDNFLSVLSKNTGGAHAYNDAQPVLKSLSALMNQPPQEQYLSSDFALWSHPVFLSVIILLLSVEWFFRKRFGML